MQKESSFLYAGITVVNQLVAVMGIVIEGAAHESMELDPKKLKRECMSRF